LAVSPLVAAVACSDDSVSPEDEGVLDLSSDTGTLNFLYALTQLESDFLLRVVNNRFPGMTASESTAFASMQTQTANQRNFFLNHITRGRISDLLTFSFAESVVFTERSSVMPAAQLILDTVAGAYAGASRYVRDPATLTLTLKLGSIAARHSATIRDLNDLAAGTGSRTSFASAEVADDGGQERGLAPDNAIAAIASFLESPLSIRNQ
jgi:hypothetical protein